MKIKLGSREIKLSRIREVYRVGSRIAHIKLKTGESLRVICGVRSHESGFISYRGSYEELEEFIDKNT